MIASTVTEDREAEDVGVRERYKAQVIPLNTDSVNKLKATEAHPLNWLHIWHRSFISRKHLQKPRDNNIIRRIKGQRED